MNMVWLLPLVRQSPNVWITQKYTYVFFDMLCDCHSGTIFSVKRRRYLLSVRLAVSRLCAAARFAFSGDILASSNRRTRLLPLRKVFTNGTTLVFVLLWVVLNVLFGLISVSPGGASVSVAWQAHLGGFFADPLVGWFENPPLSPSGGPGNVDYGEWSGARTYKNK